MTPKNITRPQVLDTAERRNYVLQQRKGGISYRDIAKLTIRNFGADKLPKNYDERYACDDVMAELKRLHDLNSETASEIRDMEEQRLDQMIESIWQKVLDGREGSIDRVLRIMQRRADLLGLDAPKGIDFTGDGLPVVNIYLPDNKRDDSKDK